MSRDLLNSRPTMIVQTVYFHESDREAAQVLGARLYQALTRPIDDPLAFGAGIPVYSAVSHEHVHPQQAVHVVAIPVLGTSTHSLMREDVIRILNQWHQNLGSSHVLPVLTDGSWRDVESSLLGKPQLTELYQASEDQSMTILEICSSLVRVLHGDPRKKPSIFVSHAKADEANTSHAAKTFADYVKNHTKIHSFYDNVELFSGESLKKGLEDSLKDGVLVVIRGDKYASRIWCQHELLVAKNNCLSTLTVEVLTSGEGRSLPYGGNGPTLVWQNNPLKVATEAMIQYVKALHFRAEGKRIIGIEKLQDDTELLIRAPELLDFSQRRLAFNGPQNVIYPDPELTTLEQDVMRAANPQLRMATPTTLYRRHLGDQVGGALRNPLEGREIGLSLSNVLEGPNSLGYTEQHMKDLTIHLARSLISAGAQLAYGGDWRRDGYTFLFSELIQAYNQSSLDSSENLKNYVAAHVPLAEQPKNLSLALMHLKERPDVARLALVPVRAGESHPSAVYFSDMRRVMTQRIMARVLIGGQSMPKKQPGPVGYGGLFPGVVEEAWWSLKQDPPQPVYVVGGFGGAAGMVAELLMAGIENRGDIPQGLTNSTWTTFEFFQKVSREILDDEYQRKLGLPDTMEDMARQIVAMGRQRKQTNGFVAWNGLTLEENKIVFSSRDPVVITALIMKGLLEKLRQQNQGKLTIELVHASLTDARDLDLLAVAAFDDVPLGGAGAALNEHLAGFASLARTEGRTFVSLKGLPIGADWLFLASLGALTDQTDVAERIRLAAEQAAQLAWRHGFKRVGVVGFGSNVSSSEQQTADAMVSGLHSLANSGVVTWFENSQHRFDAYREALAQNQRVELMLPVITRKKVETAKAESKIFLQTVWDKSNSSIRVGLLMPEGSALHSLDDRPLSEADVTAYAHGQPPNGRSTPSLQELETRGQSLGQKLLGNLAVEVIQKAIDENASIVWIHDIDSSRIPFEILSGSSLPAVRVSVSRRLAVPGIPFERLLSRPISTSNLRVLLVIDPEDNLTGAKAEGEAARKVLESLVGIKPTVLDHTNGTRAKFKAELAKADFLHYCGHAFFDGPGESENGLLLKDGAFTLADLRGAQAPQVAFVNACEAGRVRYRGQIQDDEPEKHAASFAEFFLRSGVDAYLGTYWLVGDASAKLFAETLYRELTAGKTLDQAVTTARRKLHDAHLNDWANYLLYGDGRFKLVSN